MLEHVVEKQMEILWLKRKPWGSEERSVLCGVRLSEANGNFVVEA